jgi:sensor histidine kinase regulating citrate/malate metabolism
MRKVDHLLNLTSIILIAVVWACSCTTNNNTYNTIETKIVKDTVEISRLKAENKELRRELDRRKKVKVKDMPFIVDTNWLKPRFYMVEHPDSIRINKRIEKLRDADKKEWERIEKQIIQS